MLSTLSTFTFAEVIGLNWALEKEAEPRPANLLSMKLIDIKNHVGILLVYERKPWEIFETKTTTTSSHLMQSQTRNPTVIRAPEAWQHVNLVWDNLFMISCTYVWHIWGFWRIKTRFQTNSDTACKPQGNISPSEPPSLLWSFLRNKVHHPFSLANSDKTQGRK